MEMNKKETSKIIMYKYCPVWAKNRDEVCAWLSKVCNVGKFPVDRICVDSVKKDSTGWCSAQHGAFPTNGKMVNIRRFMQQKDITVITAAGTVDGKPVNVGADLRDDSVFITLEKNNLADISWCEKAFGVE